LRHFLPRLTGVIAALSLTLLAPTLTAATAKPAKLSPPEKVTSVEGITEYRLANGMKVLLFPDPSKSTITVNVTYLVGSRHEGYGESGMAHLLEHLVFKGTPRFPNIPQELTARGARPNGTTWYDRTNYFETFAATDDNLRWALDLESDRMITAASDVDGLSLAQLRQVDDRLARRYRARAHRKPARVLQEVLPA